MPVFIKPNKIMPNKNNAKKALRQSVKKALRNKKVKTAYKEAVKNVDKAPYVINQMKDISVAKSAPDQIIDFEPLSPALDVKISRHFATESAIVPAETVEYP